MPSSSSFAVLALLAAVGFVNADRTITVKNACSYTIWPALFTSAGTAPSYATGWEAAAGSSVSFTAAEDWDGRVWARTDCTFTDDTTLPTTCSTGGCNGGLECDKSTGTGVPPASLAEFNLDGGDEDWYDVSLVDGFNLPISITHTGGCNEPKCTGLINNDCPAELSVTNTAGDVVGCETSCAANLDGNSSNSANCCSGDYDTAATCPSSGVDYYSTFKDACPDAYAYAYDESSGSALWTCAHTASADYTVTFCPSS